MNENWILYLTAFLGGVAFIVFILWGIDIYESNRFNKMKLRVTPGVPRGGESSKFPNEIIERTITIKDKGYGKVDTFSLNEFNILSEKKEMTYDGFSTRGLKHEVNYLYYGYEYKMITTINGGKIVSTRYFLIGKVGEEENEKKLRDLENFTIFIMDLSSKIPELDTAIRAYEKRNENE